MLKISLAAARKNANLTQEEVSKAMNVALSTVQNWENGKTVPKINKAIELCNLYNVPLDNIDFEKNFAD